jgi:hypothetical protein
MRLIYWPVLEGSFCFPSLLSDSLYSLFFPPPPISCTHPFTILKLPNFKATRPKWRLKPMRQHSLPYIIFRFPTWHTSILKMESRGCSEISVLSTRLHALKSPTLRDLRTKLCNLRSLSYDCKVKQSNSELKTSVFWFVVPCSSQKPWRFGGRYCLNLQGIRVCQVRNRQEGDTQSEIQAEY